MLSLDNAYSDVELREFHERICRALDVAPDTRLDYVAELKIDGLSIALTYEHGRLVRGVTRGDGVRGEDVTHNVRVIKAIPLQLRGAAPAFVEVRGEVYFPLADFARINDEREAAGLATFANPRNAASGAMRTLDSAAVGRRGLRAFTYQIVQPSGEPPLPGHARGGARTPRGLVVPGRITLAALRRHRRRDRLLSGVAGPATRARVRHGRCRHQARRHREATRPRPDRQVPAVGHRLQVSDGAGADAAETHRRQHRPDGSRHSLRRARTGAPERDDDFDGDAPQRRGSAATRHSRGRSRHDRKGRRDHSQGRRTGDRGAAAGRPARMDDADQRARSARARSCEPRARSCGGARTSHVRRGFGVASSTSRPAMR